MSYEIGTHFNFKTGEITPPNERRESEGRHFSYAVGTRVVFVNALENLSQFLVIKPGGTYIPAGA